MGNTQELSVQQQEQQLIDWIEANHNPNLLTPQGVSLYRVALQHGLPRLAKACHQLQASVVPPLRHGQSVLHFAVEQQHFSLVQAMLRDPQVYGHLKNSKDKAGRTPLHLAVLQNSPELVALLLKYNAACDIKDIQGMTPKQLALQSQPLSPEIIEQFTVAEGVTTRPPEEHKRSSLEEALAESRVPVIPSEELDMFEVINKGSSCLVYRARWRGTEVAVKEFKQEYSTSPKELQKFIKEMHVLAQVRHPNLLLLMGITLDRPNLCLITEYVPQNTLFYALHKNKERRLTVTERLSIAVQICRGLSYLHSNDPPIVHRDLKPENCLLDGACNVKIADFGLARPLSAFVNEEAQTTICIGTTRFMAPELFDKDRATAIGTEVDVWALGCVLIELFSGKRPWHYIPSTKANCIFYEIFNRKPVPIPDSIPAELAQVIRTCCDYDPAARPSVAHILRALEQAT